MGIAQDIINAHLHLIEIGKAGTCRVCGKVVSIYVPKGGDGSQRNVRHHNRDRFSGTFLTTERCPGSNDVAKEWMLRR